MTTRRNKYNAARTIVDGERFDSAAEARRYAELRLLERAGQIRNLERQVHYPLVVNDIRVCVYIADFRYIDEEGRTVVEDKKGARTAMYILKKKLMLAVHGITVLET